MDDTLSKIGGYISSKLNSFKQSALQGASQVINAGNQNMGNFYKNFAITPQKVQQTSNFVGQNVFNPIQNTVFKNPVMNDPLTSAIPFVGQQLTTSLNSMGVKPPTLGQAASTLNPFKLYDEKTKTLFPSSPMNQMGGLDSLIPKVLNGDKQAIQQYQNKWQNIGQNTAVGMMLGGGETKPSTIRIPAEEKSIMANFSRTVDEFGPKQNMGQLGVDAQHIVEQYFGPKWAHLSNDKIKQLFDYALAKREGGLVVNPRGVEIPAGLGTVEGEGLASQALKEQQISDIVAQPKEKITPQDLKVQKPITQLKPETPVQPNRLDYSGTRKWFNDQLSELKQKPYNQFWKENDANGLSIEQKQKKYFDYVAENNKKIDLINSQKYDYLRKENPNIPINQRNTQPETDPFLRGLQEDQKRLPEDIQALQTKKTSFKTGRGSVYDETGLEIAPPVEKATKTIVRNVEDELTSHQSGGYVAQVNANKTNNDFLQLAKQNNVNPNIEWKLVQYAENPTPETASRLELTPEDIQRGAPLMEKYRQLDDSVIKRAQEAGIDVNYLQNHIRHFFQEPAAKVQQVMDKMQGKGISGRPGFANERTTPNYIDIGGQLTPKYTTFGQHAAATEFELEKAIQNKQTFQGLYSNGLIKETSASPLGWKLIKSDFFRSPTNGESMSAPPEVAAKLNKYFGDTGLFADNPMARKIAEKAGQISGTWQDVKLTGGVNTVNAYTIGQTISDMTQGLGDILTGHPIRGAKTMFNPLQKMAANFDPGYASRFETAPENAKAIKQMAENNIPYRGTMSYGEMQSNVAKGFGWDSVKDKGADMWNSLSNNPTFKKFVFQRNVDAFKNLRDDYIAKGMEESQAVKLAAEGFKNSQGILTELGHDRDWANIVKSVFMAPKYREGLINKFGNVAKGMTTQITNPAFQQSRALGVGMLATYAAYNIAQKQLTGKWMWDNPPGKEMELVIPDVKDKTKYTSFPFMPGSTAIFRRGLGTASALAQGDTSEAGKQFSSMFSMPISQTGQILSNKDYWGNEIRNPNRPKIEGLPGDTMQQQLGIQAVKSVVPGPIEQAIQYGQDKTDYQTKKALGKDVQEPTPGKYFLRSMEIPIKQGSMPNPYYSAVDEVGKKYDKETVDAYNRLHPKTDPFLAKEVTDIVQRTKNNTDRWANPNIYLMERDIATRTAKETGKPIDPLYSVPTETALRYFNYERQAPKSQERKDMMAQYPELAKLMQMRSEYFKSNPIPGGSGTNPPPQPSDYVQQQMNAKNWRDPQVQAYLTASTNYANEQRKQLGLPPVAGFSSGGGVMSSAQKSALRRRIKYSNQKIRATKPKKISLKKLSQPRIKKLKAMKLPKGLRVA